MEMRILQNALHPIMFCGLLPMCRACFSMKSTNFPPPIEMCVRRTTDRPFLSSFLVLIDIEKKTHLRISHFSDENYYLFELQTRENISLLPNDLHKIEICQAVTLELQCDDLYHLQFNLFYFFKFIKSIHFAIGTKVSSVLPSVYRSLTNDQQRLHFLLQIERWQFHQSNYEIQKCSIW